MKKSLFIICIAFAIFQFFVIAEAKATSDFPISEKPHFEAGVTATVFATSGLTLRMYPEKSAEALLVIPFGDNVTVIGNHVDSLILSDRIGWIEGRWILVDYYGLQGYVFDGYLASLPMPNHESELCNDCAHLIYPFDQYLDDHFEITNALPMKENSEVVTQFVQELDHNIIRKKSYTDSWFHLEVTMAKVRVGDVLNLFRSMITNNQLKDEFERSLIFNTNNQGDLMSVKINMYGNPIRINALPDGSVKINTTVIYTEDGC